MLEQRQPVGLLEGIDNCGTVLGRVTRFVANQCVVDADEIALGVRIELTDNLLEDAEPDCSSMCGGTQIIEVAVSSDFSGAAVLETSCRAEAVSIQLGESVQILSEEDAEECGVTLFVDDEQVYDEYIEGHVSVTVTVGANGEVDEERGIALTVMRARR